MTREFEVLTKLKDHFPLVPEPYIFCADKEVIGVPFYVMERMSGLTIRDDPNSKAVSLLKLRNSFHY